MAEPDAPACPHCGDEKGAEPIQEPTLYAWYCTVCSKPFGLKPDAYLRAQIPPRFALNSRHDPKD